MEWTADVAAGDWLRERLDDPWRYTMHDVVPRGYPAYARVFHPTTRERPDGRPWPPLPFGAHDAEWDAFHGAAPEIVSEPVTWAQTAQAMGTTMHPLAQWRSLVAPGVIVENEDFPRDGAGWRYIDTREGQLDPDALAPLAGILAAHTGTPDDGFVALWDGWGDLVGGMGFDGRSSALFGVPDDDDARHAALLRRSARDVFNDVFRRPRWRPGILSDEISRAPRLEFLNRAYVLFRGGVRTFQDPAWVRDAPWRDRGAEATGFPPDAYAPSLLWPSDRAWVMVTEVDWDSTIVAGSVELVAAIVAHPGLEAAEIPVDADLSWDGDGVNR